MKTRALLVHGFVHLEAGDALDVKLVAGERSRFVETERIDAPSERNPEGLRAVDACAKANGLEQLVYML